MKFYTTSFSIPFVVCIKEVLVYTSSKFCTGLKLNHLLSCDLDLLLSSRVDTFASRTLIYRESTETEDSNLITFLQCT